MTDIDVSTLISTRSQPAPDTCMFSFTLTRASPSEVPTVCRVCRRRPLWTRSVQTMSHGSPAPGDHGKTKCITGRRCSTSQKGGVGSEGLLRLLWSLLLRRGKGFITVAARATQAETNECLAERKKKKTFKQTTYEKVLKGRGPRCVPEGTAIKVQRAHITGFFPHCDYIFLRKWSRRCVSEGTVPELA